MARLLASLLLFAMLPAQERRQPPVLPRVFALGPAPAAPVFDLWADGSLARDGAPLTLAAFGPQLGAGTREVVLRAERSTPAAVVATLLDHCRSRDVTTVWFAATLPDGTGNGAFGYALPATADVHGDPVLRLHRDRAGVPPESAEPHLRRIARALADARPEWALGIEVPDDAGLETLLQVMASAAQAGVPRAVVTARPGAGGRQASGQDLAALAAGARVPPGALAIDLGPLPSMQVRGLALPRPRALLEAGPVGLLQAAGADRPIAAGGGAGGRYGGRVGGRQRAGSVAAAIELGPAWILRQQLPDGSWPGAGGGPDVEATALVVLAFHGDGQSMESGENTDAIRRGVGWLMGQQHSDGRLGEAGPGDVHRHALALYALVEASGLSPNGRVLRGCVGDALEWLAQRRQPDGGWHDGTPGAPSDTLTTAACLLPVAAARFFGMRTHLDPAQLVGWFDTVAGPDGVHRLHAQAAADDARTPAATAAALFARFAAGQAPNATPIMRAAGDAVLAQTDPADPLGAYYASYALYQIGGRHWVEWTKRLDGAIVRTQVADGDAKGSWPPTGGSPPVATTALRMLTLEAYYRYTRLIR